ncbi:MAG: hypothetical protein LBL72_08885, partial [Candidatus Accumulibacter sp.]|nr:hypothetical protein [Accumulibacter sp.]
MNEAMIPFPVRSCREDEPQTVLTCRKAKSTKEGAKWNKAWVPHFPPDKGEMKGVYDVSASVGAFSSLQNLLCHIIHAHTESLGFSPFSPTYTADRARHAVP